MMELAETWFEARARDSAVTSEAPLSSLRVGLASEGESSPVYHRLFAELTRRLVGSGATLVVPNPTGLLHRTPTWKEHCRPPLRYPPSRMASAPVSQVST